MQYSELFLSLQHFYWTKQGRIFPILAIRFIHNSQNPNFKITHITSCVFLGGFCKDLWYILKL